MNSKPSLNPSYKILVTGIFLLLFSCSTKKITISVLKPADYVIPSSIRKVSIFSHAGTHNSKGTYDSLDTYLLKPGYNYDRLKRGYAEGFFDAALNSPRFTRLILSDTAFEMKMKNDTLSEEIIEEICHHDSTDAVMFFTAVLSIEESQVLDWDGNWEISRFYFKNVTKSYFVQPFDTIIFGPLNYIKNNIFEMEKEGKKSEYDIPGLISASNYYTGFRLGEILCPQWIDRERIIFGKKGCKEMKTAYFMATHSQWNQAGKIWYDLSANKNRKIAGKASLNLAVCWEKEDDLDQAKSWASYADSLYKSPIIKAYKDTLVKRNAERELLDQQLTAK